MKIIIKLKQTLIYLLIITLVACNSYGSKKVFDGTEIYYKDPITESQVEDLGQYLIDEEFADGQEKTIQMIKEGKTYVFRMVVKKGVEKDDEYINMFKLLTVDLSAKVFDGDDVDIHLCDETLETLRVIPFYNLGVSESSSEVEESESDGEFPKLVIAGMECYYDSKYIKAAQVEKFANFMVKLIGAAEESAQGETLRFTKDGGTYYIDYIDETQTDSELASADMTAGMMYIAKWGSREVFNDKTVVFRAVDSNGELRKSYPMMSDELYSATQQQLNGSGESAEEMVAEEEAADEGE